MLTTLDLDVSLSPEEYHQQIEVLMHTLAQLQQEYWEQRIPVMVVLEGWAASGKGALVRKLVEYMDPRGFIVHPIWPPTPEELSYPFLWRFWRKLPPRGRVSIFYHSWYGRVLEDRLFERIPFQEVPEAMREINAFERSLVDDGAVLAKFWMQVSRKELRNRLKKYAKDPLLSWRIRPEDWLQAKHYDTYQRDAEDLLLTTSSGFAPWTLVEANCRRWAQIKVLSNLVSTLKEGLDLRAIAPPPVQLPPQDRLAPMEPDRLAKVDLSQSLPEEEYREQLVQYQVELLKLQRKVHKRQMPVLVLFEGWDAAGKGGAIKRLTDTLDPRSYRVWSFAAPTEEEKQYPYLWRFWRRIPEKGAIAILDRSWYGRVLVERVEGFASSTEWQRAYREINEFEQQLANSGIVLIKFWLHISPEEQQNRFEERSNNPFRRYKLTEEDWRNRDKWAFYEVAVNQMLQRTETPVAPWHVIAANDKYYARVKILEVVTDALNQALKQRSR